MSKPKHTPGPWKAGLTDKKAIHGWSVRPPDGITPYFVATHLAEGDAHLISASPDLLEACRFALRAFQEPDWDDNFEGITLEDMLTEAIAKAEGKGNA